MVRIKGERGTFKILCHEFNPRNGKHWFSLFGGPYSTSGQAPQGRDPGQERSQT
jgi:hypothetical protein